MIPDVRDKLGCYHWVYISLRFITQYGVDKREENLGVEPDTDEEEVLYYQIFLRGNTEEYMGQRPLYMLKTGMSIIQRRRRW